MLEYKPSGGDGGSYSLSPDIKYVFVVVVVSSRVSNLCGRTSQDMSCEIRSFLIPGTLRTVPTIVIAHTFCASPDTWISYRQCLLIQGSFCAF